MLSVTSYLSYDIYDTVGVSLTVQLQRSKCYVHYVKPLVNSFIHVILSTTDSVTALVLVPCVLLCNICR